MSQKLVAALSLEAEGDPIVENPAEETALALTVEEDAAEITDLTQTIEEGEDQIDALETAETSMEAIMLSMESALKADPAGFDRTTAEAYHLAVKATIGTALPNPMMSLESFGGTSQRAESSKLSMEAVGETLKAIWEAIKRAIANAITAVANFFAKLFGSVKKLRERANKIAGKVAELKKAGAKADGEMTVPAAGRLYMAGKMDQSILDRGIKITTGQLITITEEVSGEAKSYYTALASAITKPESLEENLKKIHLEGEARVKKTVQKMVGEELPGGKAFAITATQNEGENATMSVPRLVDYTKKINFNGKAEIKVPSLDWCGKAVESMIELVDWMDKKKSVVEELKKTREEVVKKADELVKASDAGKLSQAVTKVQVRLALRSANKDYNSSIARVDGYIFNYVRNMLTVVDAATKQYKTK